MLAAVARDAAKATAEALAALCMFIVAKPFGFAAP
jgi:hypothetical protein